MASGALRSIAWLAVLSMLGPLPAVAGTEHHEHRQPAAKGEAAATGVCMVCKVKHGEAEPEPVKATRTHDGESYGFCSEDCAREFASDPLAYLPPEFPREAPGFTLTDLAGRSVSLESLKGRVVLLDFWATWCAPCRKSMPELQALHARYAARGLTVLGVSIDEKADAKVKKLVKDKGFTYPVAVDSASQPAWQAYRVKSIPAAYLIDRDGHIVAQWTGAAAPAEELEARVRALVGGE